MRGTWGPWCPHRRSGHYPGDPERPRKALLPGVQPVAGQGVKEKASLPRSWCTL